MIHILLKKERVCTMSYTTNYRSGQPTYGHQKKQERDSTPPFLFFRLRIILCLMIFGALFIKKEQVFEEKEVEAFFTLAEQDYTPEEWKNYPFW